MLVSLKLTTQKSVSLDVSLSETNYLEVCVCLMLVLLKLTTRKSVHLVLVLLKAVTSISCVYVVLLP